MWFGIVAIVYILIGLVLWKDFCTSSQYNSLRNDTVRRIAYFTVVFGWLPIIITGLILYMCGVDIRGKDER